MYSVAGSSYPSAVWHHVQNVNFYYVWSGAGKFVLLKYLFAPILLCVCAWCVCVCVNWCVPLANNAKLALFIYANGCGQEAPLAARNAGCSQCQHGERLCCFPHCPPHALPVPRTHLAWYSGPTASSSCACASQRPWHQRRAS